MLDKNIFADKTTIEKKQLASYAFLHFVNDFHATLLPNVLPILRQALSLSLAQLGVLNAAFGIMHFFGQPIAGSLADRQAKPWFATWGPLLSIISIYFLPCAPSFLFAVILCILLGIGTSMFHPQGNGRTGKIAMGKNLPFYLAIFIASGSLGSAFGPLSYVFWYNRLGKKLLPLMILPFLLILFWLWHFLSAIKFDTTQSAKNGVLQFFSEIKQIFVKIIDIFTIVSIRDMVFQGVKVFLPMLIILRGGTIATAAKVTFAIVLATAFSNIIGGRLAAIFGERKLLFATLTLCPLLGIAGIALPRFYGILFLMLFFALLESSAPATISMSQKRCQDNISTVSSIASGASWGVANLAAYPVGALADKIGLEYTLYTLISIPWLVSLICLFKYTRRGKN